MYQEVDGATLYYKEYGSGDKYIISAQMGFDLDEKGWPMDLAEEGYHVFTIQIRGYGKSTHVYEDLGDEWYNIWADDVYEFARRKGIEKFLYTGRISRCRDRLASRLKASRSFSWFCSSGRWSPFQKRWRGFPGRLETIKSAGDPEASKKRAEQARNNFLYFANKFSNNPELRKEFEGKAEKGI